jgi:hypothetical protein
MAQQATTVQTCVSTQYGVRSPCCQRSEKVKADLEVPLENFHALRPRREDPTFCVRTNRQLRVSRRDWKIYYVNSALRIQRRTPG